MRAALYSRYGGPDEVRIATISPRPLAPGRIRVRVIAAGVNPLDWKLVRGDLKFVRGRRWPRQLGTDFAGCIIGIGSAVTGWSVNEAVFGSLTSFLGGQRGAFAEEVDVLPREIVRLPAGVPLPLAAALPIAGASAATCCELAGVDDNHDVLVIGATGGVGSYATVLARKRGARVTGVCRAINEAGARELGAATVLAHDRQDPLAVRSQFDAILDIASVYSFARCKHLLKPRGTYVATNPGPAHMMQAAMTRLTGGRQARNLMVKVTPERLAALAALAGEGAFAPVALSERPFEDIAATLAVSRDGHKVGKLVLRFFADPA